MKFAICEKPERVAQSSSSQLLLKLLMLLICVGSLNSVGCQVATRAFQNYRKKGYPEKAFEGYRDHVWAKRSYNLRFGNCNMAYEGDFHDGFIEGYCNSCNGGDGTPPALPPNEYWGTQYQNTNGQKAIQAWYKGYPEGVKAAKQDGVAQNKKIFISNEMNGCSFFFGSCLRLCLNDRNGKRLQFRDA